MTARAVLLFALAACSAPQPTAPGSLSIAVTENGAPTAARVLLVGADGPLHLGTLDLYKQRQGAGACAFGPNAIGTWNGIVVGPAAVRVPVGGGACQVPRGTYRVVAWRGIEYERWEGDVDLTRGDASLAIALERAWTPTGTLAADLHVHARDSDDSNMPNAQRVLAQLAAGLQVIGLANHNVFSDATADIAALHLEDRIAAIPGSEFTAEQLHAGVYPVSGAAPAKASLVAATAEQMFAIARALPGRPIIQVNHPRFRYAALFDTTKWDGTSWPPPFPLDFDAMEVLNGFTAFDVPGDRRSEDSARDLYTLYAHGKLVAPMGNSDTHDYNWVTDGAARTYVFVPDARVHPFDQTAFVGAIRARRTEATDGPWLDVKVGTAGPGESIAAHGTVWVDVTLSQARFVHTDHIWIHTAAGLAQTIDVPPNARTHHWAGSIPIGERDTFVGVTAGGDTAMPLEQTGTYQRDKWKRAGDTPFAIASPILVDADGDGRYFDTPLGNRTQ